MKNLKLGKIIKKSITLIVTLAFVFSMSVSAAVTLDADVTKDNATLTVNCGESFAGKNVVVQVFEPMASIENLAGDGAYTEIDAEIIEDALVCVYHGKLDNNGKVKFTVAPTGPKGVYGVRISVKGIYEVTETEFVFSSDYDAQQVVDKLVNDPDADAVADVLYIDTEVSDRVYQPYQILQLQDNEYFKEYLENEDLKASIHENVAANIPEDADVSPADFVGIFECAVVVENVDFKTGDELGEYIDNNADILGLSERNEYKNVYKNPELFTEDDIAALLSVIENTPFSGKTPVAVADKFCEEILVNLLPGKDDAPGVVDKFIQDYDKTLETYGADIAAYKEASKPLDICSSIIAKAPFETIKDFADAVNAALKANANAGTSTTQPSKPSGGSGSIKSEGGSSGFGGGTSYTPKTEQPQEAEKEPVKEETSKNIFADVASTHWAFEAVEALKTEGIVAGKGDGNFAPNDNVTREEFVKMLVGILGIETNGASANLADVNGTEWFAPYIYAAYNSGIVNGVGEGFGVGQNITRQDMAVLCARAIENKGVTLNSVRDTMTFADSISDYAVAAVEKLWKAGLVNGKSETEFAPTATATRAEAAKMLYEVLKVLK